MAEGFENVKSRVVTRSSSGGWGTAVAFFLSFRAWLTKILHCQHANPELNCHTEHTEVTNMLDTTHTNNNTMTSAALRGGTATWCLRSFEENIDAGMTGNMRALLSPQSP